MQLEVESNWSLGHRHCMSHYESSLQPVPTSFESVLDLAALSKTQKVILRGKNETLLCVEVGALVVVLAVVAVCQCDATLRIAQCVGTSMAPPVCRGWSDICIDDRTVSLGWGMLFCFCCDGVQHISLQLLFRWVCRLPDGLGAWCCLVALLCWGGLCAIASPDSPRSNSVDAALNERLYRTVTHTLCDSLL
jgi:hypothetical protein